MTFQAYQRTLRLGAALGRLQDGADALAVGLDHGYESLSGFRDAFTRVFGTTPGRARDTEYVVADLLPSPVGPLLATAGARGICSLGFAERERLGAQIDEIRRWTGRHVVPGRDAHLEQLAAQLEEYFAARRREFTVPLDYRGTAFQMAVWAALCGIAYGQTISYEELARRAGRPGAQRAAGMANHCNRVAIVIPCHRVVNKNGQLGGYGGGLWRKQMLLDLERGALAGPRATERTRRA